MNNIEVIARALVVSEGKILLARKKGESWYFLPGGHVEFGEEAEKTLVREIKEEMDILPLSLYYIGLGEEIFEQDGRHRHEYDLVFKTELERNDVTCLDDYAEFVWVDLSQLPDIELRPETLKKAIQKWLNDQQPFWAIPSYY